MVGADLGRRAAVVLSLLLLGGGFGTLAAQAYEDLTASSAAPQGRLVVTRQPQTATFTDWRPGTSRFWRLSADLAGDEAGTFQLRLAGTGELVTDETAGLRVAVHTCSSPYLATLDGAKRPVCPAHERTILGPERLAELVSEPTTETTTKEWRLSLLRAGEPRHLLVELAVPELGPTTSVRGMRARFGVGLYAQGLEAPVPDVEDPGPHPDPWSDPLPNTGGPQLGLLLIGLGALGLGLVVRRREP